MSTNIKFIGSNDVTPSNTVLCLSVTQDDLAVKSSSYRSASVLVSSKDNQLFTLPAVCDRDGKILLDFSCDELVALSNGSYGLSVYLDGSSYPSEGSVPFTIGEGISEDRATLINTLMSKVDDKFKETLFDIDEKVKKSGTQVPREATFTDYNAVAADMPSYEGSWFTAGNSIANGPEEGMLYTNVTVTAGNAKGIGRILVHSPFGNQIYLGDVYGDKVEKWTPLSKKPSGSDLNDSEVNSNASLNGLKTDKAGYAPGEYAKFQVSVKGNKGKLKIEYFNLGKVVDSQNISYSATPVSWEWQTPNEDKEQYFAKVTNITDTGLDVKYIALNVASDPSMFPIMGFLSKFHKFDPVAQEKVIEKLSRLHVNYLQYYDYFQKHDRPVWVGEHGETSTYWRDYGNRPTRYDTISDYIRLGKHHGMKNMAYGLLNGASFKGEQEGFTKDMFLFDDNSGSWDKVAVNKRAEGSIFLYDIYLNDFTNDKYIELAQSRFEDVLKQFDFDGWHIDTLGPNGDRYDSKGNKLEAGDLYSKGYKKFIDAMTTKYNDKSTWGKKDIGFNAVSTVGQGTITTNDGLAYIYSEIWDNDHTYQDIYRVCTEQLRMGFAKNGLILPAYMHHYEDMEDHPKNGGYFKDAAVALMDLIVMSAGATRLEMGEHMLLTEYFPNSWGKMSDWLDDWLVKQYDFLVGYHKLLGIRVPKDYVPIASITDHRYYNNQIAKDGVSIIEKEDNDHYVVSLINTNGINDDDWRDNDMKREFAPKINNFKFSFGQGRGIKDNVAYYATVENPEPVQVTLDENNSFVVPELDKYVLIWADKMQMQ